MNGTRLSGAISFENFAGMRQAGEALVDQATGTASIDLQAIEHANSLTVGAMVAWFRHAQKQGKSVSFTHVPPDLRKIIRVSGLTDILLPGETTSTPGAGERARLPEEDRR